MAQALFDRETPVLSYRPRAHVDPGKRNDRQYLLWPAVAFRVVAPDVEPRKLNVLQKVVLMALHAASLTAEELGERLGIHRELVACVMDELQVQGRLDASFKVTRRGEADLEDELDASARLTPAWIFRDPWSGEIWPYLASSLEHAEVLVNDAGWPMLDLGSAGRPWTQPVWMQQPPARPDISSPDAREILRAARRHRSFDRLSSRMPLYEDTEEATEALQVVRLDRLRCIEPEPKPVYLVTFLYLPHEGPEQGYEWHACDPFGRGRSPMLRQRIVQLVEADQRLRPVLDRLLGSSGFCKTFEEFKRERERNHLRALTVLERSLTASVRTFGVWEPLQEMMEGWLEAEYLEEQAAPWRRRAVLLSCRRALERLLCDLAGDWPLAGLERQLSDDTERNNQVNRARMERAARGIGLQLPLPGGVTNIRKSKLYAVANRGDHWNLRPMAAATVLAAEQQPGHPLRAAAEKDPSIIHRLEEVASGAGEAIHDGPAGGISLKSVERCVDLTMQIIGTVLDLPSRPLAAAKGE